MVYRKYLDVKQESGRVSTKRMLTKLLIINNLIHPWKKEANEIFEDDLKAIPILCFQRILLIQCVTLLT